MIWTAGPTPCRLFVCAVLTAAATGFAGACADPEAARAKATTIPTYDPVTGKLQRLTGDLNKNGTIDSWLYMDGARPVRAERDVNEDGKVEYWETYREDGKTLDSTARDESGDGRPDKWETYGPEGLQTVEWDDNADGVRDRRWTYGRDGQPAWIESGPDGTGGYTSRTKASR